MIDLPILNVQPPKIDTFQIMKLIQHLAIIATVTAFAGCASTSDNSEKSLADQIRQGMTKEEVLKVAGKPQNKHSGLVGQADEVWLYSDSAMNLIPVYGLVRGGRINTTNVSFKKGRVVTVGQGSFGLW